MSYEVAIVSHLCIMIYLPVKVVQVTGEGSADHHEVKEDEEPVQTFRFETEAEHRL